MSSRTNRLDADARPPGWNEAIAAALRAAPEVNPAIAETVAGLLIPHTTIAITEHRRSA
jgi:hypothetical protein